MNLISIHSIHKETKTFELNLLLELIVIKSNFEILDYFSLKFIHFSVLLGLSDAPLGKWSSKSINLELKMPQFWLV